MISHTSAPAARARTRHQRRQAAITMVSPASTHTVLASSAWKREMVPVILFPFTFLGELWAMLPAVKKLFEVSPGTTNHMNRMPPSAPYSHQR